MSCQNCDLPLIPGEPNCGNCGYPVPAEAAQAVPKAPVAFPSVATVYLAEQPQRGSPKKWVDSKRERPEPANSNGAAAAGPGLSSDVHSDIGLTRGRPAGFPGGFTWLMSGAARNRRGLVTALVAGWSNLPIAVLLGTVGAATGMVAGFGGSAARAYDQPGIGPVLPVEMTEPGGTAGAVGGAIAGAVDGFVDGLAGPWWATSGGDTLTVVAYIAAQLLVGIVLGFVYLVASVAFEAVTLRAKGARRLSRREAELIMPIVEESAELMGIEGRPNVMMLDTGAVRAFAGSRHIVISQGLIDDFDYDRAVLAGVVAHQLTHWNNADAVAATLVRGMALPLYLGYLAAAKVMTSFPHPVVRLLVWVLAWPVLLTVRRLVVPLQGADQRRAEYRADQGAVLAGQRDGMRRLLVRRGGPVDGGRSGWDDVVTRTHPPAELRLEALEERDTGYHLPDRDAMPRPLPIEIMRSRNGGHP